MKSKLIKIGLLLFLFFGLLLLCRKPIMMGFADFLIVESEITQVDYGFVLSGGAFDRGTKAAELYHEDKVLHFICTGENQPPDLKALGLDTLESDLTKLQMLKMGVPDAAITLICSGTSTMEESDIILSYCQVNNLDTIVVISGKFHTRRVHQVFTEKFEEQGIIVLIQGASSSSYDEEFWWESEYGLIALNNEYLKQLYYLIKY